MKIQRIDNTNFGMKFKLSDNTLNAISESTKLTVNELHRLPLDEAANLMKKRGSLKEPSKFKQWFSGKYKEFGEKYGLLKKHYNIYTDVD